MRGIYSIWVTRSKEIQPKASIQKWIGAFGFLKPVELHDPHLLKHRVQTVFSVLTREAWVLDDENRGGSWISGSWMRNAGDRGIRHCHTRGLRGVEVLIKL